MRKLKTACLWICTGLFCAWILLFLSQIWLPSWDDVLFLKITLTMAGLFLIAFAVFIVAGQLTEDKQLRDNDYLN